MYQKKRYSSALFGADVWIVNVGIEQAMADPEIADSGMVVFTNSEIAQMKQCPSESKELLFEKIYLVKKNLLGSQVSYVGPQIDLGPGIDIHEDVYISPPEPVEQPKRRRRAISLEEGDALGQGRFLGIK